MTTSDIPVPIAATGNENDLGLFADLTRYGFQEVEDEDKLLKHGEVVKWLEEKKESLDRDQAKILIDALILDLKEEGSQ